MQRIVYLDTSKQNELYLTLIVENKGKLYWLDGISEDEVDTIEQLIEEDDMGGMFLMEHTDIMGYYRGAKDVILKAFEKDGWAYGVDGPNGDGSDDVVMKGTVEDLKQLLEDDLGEEEWCY
jgi:hypothetical protein